MLLPVLLPLRLFVTAKKSRLLPNVALRSPILDRNKLSRVYVVFLGGKEETAAAAANIFRQTLELIFLQ